LACVNLFNALPNPNVNPFCLEVNEIPSKELLKIEALKEYFESNIFGLKSEIL